MDNDNYKYYLNIIMSVALVCFVLLITIIYGLKSPLIIKLLALTINILTLFYAYKTIKNKPNNN